MSEALVEQYKPVVYLHSAEKFWPMRIADYVPHCRLINFRTRALIEEGPLTMTRLYDKCREASSEDWGLQLLSERDPVIFGTPSDLERVPFYANWYEQNNKLYLNYYFFYGYNSYFYVGGVYKTGNHHTDLELIVLELDPETHTVERLFYSEHAGGRWYIPDQVLWEQETHPVVYSARGSHASYTTSGIHHRILGFANDITDDQGARWFPTQCFYMYPDITKPDTEGFLAFQGNMGDDSVRAIQKKPNYRAQTNLATQDWIQVSQPFSHGGWATLMSFLFLLVIFSIILISFLLIKK